jgi:hypothetical protein
MNSRRFGVGGKSGLYLATALSLLVHGAFAARAEEPARDAQALAARIDRLVAAAWEAKGVQPAEPADDAEFLRRVYLDLGGRIPRVAEVRDFLADPAPDKRQRLVERLLESPYYVTQFTNFWRALLLPQSGNQQVQFLVPSFEAWVRLQVRDGVPYDRMVRELLTTPVSGDPRLAIGQGSPSPLVFYQANELKPENLGASTSRLFLGVNLECAQCHDHPFAPWTRQQFWEYTAFFSGIQTRGPGNVFAPALEVADRRAIKIPGTDKVVEARYLNGGEPAWKTGTSTRTTLANWLTAADNSYFARAAANRLWSHFFGLGLTEPVDEAGDQNPPSHPELLDELAREFAAHQFDVKFLIRALTASRAYQLTSQGGDPARDDPRLFARMALKGLTPEQLFDSLATATGYRETAPPDPRVVGPRNNSPRAEFLTKFASQEKRTEYQTSILQALSLMNGRFVGEATSLERSETLAAVADAPFLDLAGRIDTLYLAALSRPPRPDEVQRFQAYVASGGAKGEARAALADVFWALLNSPEFLLNH